MRPHTEDREGSPAQEGKGEEERSAERRAAKDKADALHQRRRQLLKQLHAAADGVCPGHSRGCTPTASLTHQPTVGLSCGRHVFLHHDLWGVRDLSALKFL